MAPLIPLAVGAGVSAITGILSGIQNRKAKKEKLAGLSEVQDRVDLRQKELDDWYNKEAYTESAASKAQITKLMDYVKGRNEQGKAQAALTGGSDEAVIAQNTASSKIVGDSMNNVAINEDARKNALRSEHNQRQSGLDSLFANISQARANTNADFHTQNAANWANVGKNAGDAASSFAWMQSF